MNEHLKNANCIAKATSEGHPSTRVRFVFVLVRRGPIGGFRVVRAGLSLISPLEAQCQWHIIGLALTATHTSQHLLTGALDIKGSQSLSITNSYASLLARLPLSFCIPVPPPNVMHECLSSGPRDIFSTLPDKQLSEAPVNLCIRDQKPRSAFVSVSPRSSNRAHALTPDMWTVFPASLDCEAPVVPLKAKENLRTVLQPTRRRAGWKGLSVCAACFRPFGKMSDLNQHYMQKHHDLLKQEWTAALIKRQRRCYKTSNHRRLFCDQPQTQTEVSTVETTSGNAAQSQSQLPTKTCDRLVVGTTEKSPRKSHVCPWCSYCAKWPTELQKHIVVHANSRPYTCIICSNCYKWSWDLGRHFSTVHAGLPNPYKMNKRSLRAQIQRSKCDRVAV
ncbi:gastrula zinc finger protein xFG20 1 [Echinococcus multilocularis]|uniref:Gastrula zinc finger protein xFG20 1 n=1 Tax=Echinococcus multilocularis TaxID=6211 RepID=A0A068Y5V1_ECHMU|nr:gastrula zinc finger protein xFG20 1 [Echinococcus multilocularis]